MTKSLPPVICDLDGTVVDLLAEICAFVFKTTGVAVTPKHCWTYYLHDAFSPYLCPSDGNAVFASDEALNQFLSRTCYHNPKLYKQAKPHWALWYALTSYIRAGGHVVILTARGKHLHGVREATEYWVSRWLPEASRIHYAEDYGSGTTPQRKHEGCSHIAHTDPCIIIDDSPEVVHHLCLHGPEDWKILMPKRPWTVRGCGHPRAPATHAHTYLQDLVAQHRHGGTSDGTTN